MESVLGRYRNLIVLVLVLFLQVLGLAVQVRTGANEGQDTRLIRIWAVSVVTPFERALVWVQNSSGSVWHNYFYLRGVRAENRRLKDQIEQMRLDQVRLNEDAAQAHRLQNLLAFKEQFIAKTVASQVIGSSGSDLSRVIYIDKGKSDGIDADMAVITADGVVGKVLFAYPSEAQVLLIRDHTSGVGAILEKSRVQGVLRGTPDGEIVLEKVMSDEEVQPGERVMTSGGDRIFPKGLPIGTVTKVMPGKDLFLTIKIKPAADLSKLEEVLVLVEKQNRQAVAEENVHVRAADILAQRLPSVPDKPATGAATSPAGVTTAGTPNPAGGVNAGSKPSGTAANAPGGGAVKNAATAGQPVKSTTSQNTSVAKPKPVNSAPAGTNPSVTGLQPSSPPLVIEPKPVEQKPVEQKPAQPVPQTPAQDNSPQ